LLITCAVVLMIRVAWQCIKGQSVPLRFILAGWNKQQFIG
jgi:hypothetical protein